MAAGWSGGLAGWQDSVAGFRYLSDSTASWYVMLVGSKGEFLVDHAVPAGSASQTPSTARDVPDVLTRPKGSIAGVAREG